MDITIDRWLDAQNEERKFHNLKFEEGYNHYKKTYEQYFKYLGINPNLGGKKICEIGPADFPALAYCSNRGNSFVVEPMPSEILKELELPIDTRMAEDVDMIDCDEVWLFNVLQHTMDPDAIVWRAKGAGKIRFFEPINYGTDECHLHNFTLKDFQDWFGFERVKYYPKNNNASYFHQWECAYGVWQ
jgi:hypothetical protein